MTQGEALELIRYNAHDGKFEVGDKALGILRQIRSPLSVVAVCGRARQGKSFILNQLLQVTGGFQIGSTTRPCTKGLWMWSTPQRRVDAAGKEFYIVLLDTEGIDAYDQTAQYSTQIFSLAVLLSSLFVYNQMGGIDEAALDRLSLADSTKDLGQFTPAFLWLLRDFYLKLEDEHGRKVTPNDYLETALLPVSGSGPAVEAKNQIRTSIKSLFPDRDCATLVRPMHDEQALVNLDSTPLDQLRPEFRDGVDSLIQLIFSKASPKRVSDVVMNGAVLAGLTEAYVKAINAGAVPTIATAWQGVAEQECRRAADSAEAAYALAFNEGVAAEEDAMDKEHQRCLAVAQAAYHEAAIGDARIQHIHQQKYIDSCAARFAQMRARKLAEAAAVVNELLLKASKTITAAMSADDASPGAVQQLLSQLLNQYLHTATGPQKWVKLVDFLKDTYPQVMKSMMARQEAQARADVLRLAEELGLVQKQAATWHAQADKADVELGQVRSQLAYAQSQVEQLQGQLLQQAQQLAELRVVQEDKAAQASALDAQLREQQLVAEKKLLSVQQEADAQMRHARLTAQQEITSLQSQLGAEQRVAAELRTQVSELEASLVGTSAQLASARQEGCSHLKKLNEAVADKSKLLLHVDELKLAVAAAEMQKGLAERQQDDALAQLAELQDQLQEIGAEIEDHMHEAEQERRRSQMEVGSQE
eukprot:gene3802-4059_t